MLYVVVEHFRNGDPRPAYARFRERGRLAPEGLAYVNSWVTTDLKHCYQVMECADRALLDEWMAAWSAVVDFQVFPVLTSAEAAAMIGSQDVPETVVLPPVLVGGALLLGIALHYSVWNIEMMPVIIARPLGLTLFVASGLLAHSAQLAMKRAGTNIRPTQPTLAIVTDGPYRFTRNPLCVAALGVYLGVALWVNGVAPLLLLVPVAWMLHWGIVLREERYLHAKFGTMYETYRSQVRRWL